MDQSGNSFAYDISGELSIDMVIISLIYNKEKNNNNKESLNVLRHSKSGVAIATDRITSQWSNDLTTFVASLHS